MEVVAVMLAGVAAGIVAGALGVGGGVVFVPALVLGLGSSQVEAEATSLLAIVPVALVGAWRQHGYGNVRVREGVLLGCLATAGAAGGVVLVNVLPEATVRAAFAALLLVTAAQLARRGLGSGRDGPGVRGDR